jgi:hypothetical protein
MSWAKLDDRFHENRKVRGLWRRHPAALGLHVMALTYCAGHETDGVVDLEFVEDKVPGLAVRRKMTQALVDAGMWTVTDNGWMIHDFLDFHPSRAALEARREADRERKSRGGRNGTPRDSRNVPAGIPSDSERKDVGIQGSSESPVPTRPDQTTNSDVVADATTSVSQIDARRQQAEDITAVWDAYVQTRTSVLGSRSVPSLTPERRALIAKRLKSYPAGDLIAAVKGWRHFPHNRGENDQARPYCDIELVLRINQQTNNVERFRDAEATAPGGSSEADVRRKLLEGPKDSPALLAMLEDEGVA